MRDWGNAFRRASFKGVGFRVDAESPEGGRRVSVHEISGGEASVVEDMGRLTKTYAVSAYIASDLADVEGAALEAICDTPGPGVLVLPMDPFVLAICNGCRRNRRKEENGIIVYDLSFVRVAAAGAVAMSGLSTLREAFSGGLAGVASAMRGAV